MTPHPVSLPHHQAHIRNHSHRLPSDLESKYLSFFTTYLYRGNILLLLRPSGLAQTCGPRRDELLTFITILYGLPTPLSIPQKQKREPNKNNMKTSFPAVECHQSRCRKGVKEGPSGRAPNLNARARAKDGKIKPYRGD
jgi:hypothetical protein